VQSIVPWAAREFVTDCAGNEDISFAIHLPLDSPWMLFTQPYEELPDDEIAEVLRQSIANAGGFPRHADLFLAGICAEHLIEGLRAAGLLVIGPLQWRLHQ
jgi:hypothetical protein